MTPALRVHIPRNYLSPEWQFILPPFNDADSINNKIETVHLNGICTIKMLKSLVHMVMKIRNEMKQPKNKNTALKSQILGFLGGNSNYKLPKTQFYNGSLPAHSTLATIP